MSAMTEIADIFDRPATCDPVLEVKSLTVRFGGVVAIQDVDLDVGRHDILCLIGPNGAGKTTALNAISHTVPSTGAIGFDGRAIGRSASWQMARLGIGRTFQDPVLIENQSVIENILAGAHTRLGYGITRQLFMNWQARRIEAQFVERSKFLLTMLGIERYADDHASSLPYGARKLVDIARAAISGPKLLLLDEPTSGLDQRERDMVQSALVRLRDAQCVAIVAVEHNMEVVRSVATSVTALATGMVLASGAPGEVLDSDVLQSAFIAPPRIAHNREDPSSKVAPEMR